MFFKHPSERNSFGKHSPYYYPVIYIIVLESIQLSGLVATHLSDWANWQYMHWLVIGLLIVVWFCVFFLTRPFRVAKKMPLYGIDWTGALLWTLVLFAIVFVCIYGEYYDWLDSPLIRGCLVTAVVATLININRMCTLRHPYIDPQVLTYRHFPTILFLFLMLCLFLTTSSVLQETFMRSILKYDMLNAVSLTGVSLQEFWRVQALSSIARPFCTKDINC